MKRFFLLLGLLLLMLLTNPRLPAHRVAVVENFQQEFPPSEAGKKAGVDYKQLAIALQENATAHVFRQDFFLFSLTKSDFSSQVLEAPPVPPTRTIGIGLLGQVLLWGHL